MTPRLFAAIVCGWLGVVIGASLAVILEAVAR